jgi:probable HAF family extracellular repeat protein
MISIRHRDTATAISSALRLCVPIGVPVVSLAEHAAAQCYYTYTTVPNPPGQLIQCIAAAINERGHVAGRVATLSENSRAFVWTPESGTVVLPLPAGILDMRATGLNDFDQVVGYMMSASDWFAFVWDGESYTIINHPPWATDIQAAGINNAGQVVGVVANTITGPLHAFTWYDGVLLDLGPQISEEDSLASSVNEKGEVIGYARVTLPRGWQSFVWKDGTIRWLTHPSELDASRAEAASNNGFFVGRGTIEEPIHNEGIVWTPWDTDLVPAPADFRDAFFRDINDAGRAVGYYDRSITRGAIPVVWQNGVVSELSPLVRPSAPPNMELATAINNAGQIAVTYHSGGTVILNPVWLPGDLTGDCHVSIEDLALVLSNFGAPRGTFPLGDVDLDGQVDLADLALVLAGWGQ